MIYSLPNPLLHGEKSKALQAECSSLQTAAVQGLRLREQSLPHDRENSTGKAAEWMSHHCVSSAPS